MSKPRKELNTIAEFKRQARKEAKQAKAQKAKGHKAADYVHLTVPEAALDPTAVDYLLRLDQEFKNTPFDQHKEEDKRQVLIITIYKDSEHYHLLSFNRAKANEVLALIAEALIPSLILP